VAAGVALDGPRNHGAHLWSGSWEEEEEEEEEEQRGAGAEGTGNTKVRVGVTAAIQPCSFLVELGTDNNSNSNSSNTRIERHCILD
jgi:hypothetical protein